MVKLKLNRTLGAILLFTFGVQTILISNGLLGVSILSLKKLCTCDHSEDRFLHDESHEEDEVFSSNSHSLPGLQTLRVALTFSKKTESLPDPEEICHTTTQLSLKHHGNDPMEPHFCPHETSKQNVENTALALNALQLGEIDSQIQIPAIILSYMIEFPKSNILQGFDNLPYEPPRC